MVDMTNDVNRFEEMFADRFTENDTKFMELKSKSLPDPVVIHPWRIQKKVWSKRWDYSSRRNREDRGSNYDRRRNDDRHQDRSRGEGNSRSSHRDRSRDREYSRERFERSQDKEKSRDNRDKKYDYQAALKAYSER